MSNFPLLHGEDSKGKTRVWSIRVFARNGCGVIETTYGLLGGKMTVNERDVCVGKNIGKKNETTPLQQAVAEARSSWVKTKESGYSEVDVSPSNTSKRAMESCSAEEAAMESARVALESCRATKASNAASNAASSPARAARAASPAGRASSPVGATTPKASRGKGIDASVPLPMLAHEYSKRGKGVYPCFVQPKLDGTRCIGIPGKGLFSRLRKTFPHMEHIADELNLLRPDIIFDGELYTNELTFQQIVGLVKKETLREEDVAQQRKIKYHVYDLVMPGTFEERYAFLKKVMREAKFKNIVLVPTERCASEEEMKAKHNEYVAAGFEGIMLRNPAGLYKHSRSADLLKYKEFIDEEFTVVGFTEGDGQDKGCVVWICETEEKKRFQCRPRGTKEERKEMFQNGDSYIGKKLTVRFQEWSDAHIPRFPVGIAFRDYE